MSDIEMQKDSHPPTSDEKQFDQQSSSVVYERTVSTKKKFLALLEYFVCNVGLTLYNKAVLGKASDGRCRRRLLLMFDTLVQSPMASNLGTHGFSVYWFCNLTLAWSISYYQTHEEGESRPV